MYQKVVHKERHQDPHHNGQLERYNQPSPVRSRCDLRDIGRGKYRGYSHGQTTDKAGQNEELNMACQAGAECGQEKEDGRYLEHIPPAISVAGPAGPYSSHNASKQGGAYSPAGHHIAQLEMLGKEGQGPVNNGCVKSI